MIKRKEREDEKWAGHPSERGSLEILKDNSSPEQYIMGGETMTNEDCLTTVQDCNPPKPYTTDLRKQRK